VVLTMATLPLPGKSAMSCPSPLTFPFSSILAHRLRSCPYVTRTEICSKPAQALNGGRSKPRPYAKTLSHPNDAGDRQLAPPLCPLPTAWRGETPTCSALGSPFLQLGWGKGAGGIGVGGSGPSFPRKDRSPYAVEAARSCTTASTISWTAPSIPSLPVLTTR